MFFQEAPVITLNCTFISLATCKNVSSFLIHSRLDNREHAEFFVIICTDFFES